MHLECVSIFDKIIESPAGEQLVEIRQLRRAADTLAAFEVVDEMLWQAAFAETRNASKTSTPLFHAANILEDYIHNHGSDLIDKAFAISSGHIPNADKPINRYAGRAPAPVQPSNGTYVRKEWELTADPNHIDSEEELITKAKAEFHTDIAQGLSLEAALRHCQKWLTTGFLMHEISKRPVASVHDGEPVFGFEDITRAELDEAVLKTFPPELVTRLLRGGFRETQVIGSEDY